MNTYLKIATTMGVHCFEVKNWEEAVTKVQSIENDIKMHGATPTFAATFYEAENRSWVRVIENDGSVVWYEE